MSINLLRTGTAVALNRFFSLQESSPPKPKKVSNRTVFIHLTNHAGDTVIIPEHMTGITIQTQMPPNMHNIVGKGLRYHPSHKPPKIVIFNNPIFHKYLIERYIDDGLTPIGYVKWLEDFRKSALPGWVTIESDNPNYDTDMEVLIDFEMRNIEHGREDDIPYNLTLYEFIDEKVELADVSQLPPRKNNLPPVPNVYVPMREETPQSVTRQITGTASNWRDLEQANRGAFGEGIGNVPSGFALDVPTFWAG